MDDHESISIIMMLALSALLGVITLICWCRELWQERAAIRWATQPIVDSADKGDGLESVQHGLRDADMDLAAATDQAISLCFASASWQSKISSLLDRPKKNPARTTGR
jgi:hypothetical protein